MFKFWVTLYQDYRKRNKNVTKISDNFRLYSQTDSDLDILILYLFKVDQITYLPTRKNYNKLFIHVNSTLYYYITHKYKEIKFKCV